MRLGPDARTLSSRPDFALVGAVAGELLDVACGDAEVV